MTTTAAAPTALGTYAANTRRLLTRSLWAAVIYGVFARASRGGCAADAFGESVCVTATISPSPLVWLTMALVAVWALDRAARVGERDAQRRFVSRASWGILAIPAVGYLVPLVVLTTVPADALVQTPMPFMVEITRR